MAVRVYASSTSAFQESDISFHLSNDSDECVKAALIIKEFTTGLQVASYDIEVASYPTPVNPAADYGWPAGITIDIRKEWGSGLYFAEVDPGTVDENRAYFVVRPGKSRATAEILVSIPFPTYIAYTGAGTPGASPYWTEHPDRGRRVSLRRPSSIGPLWEAPILNWLYSSGYNLDYCSGFDLHNDAHVLDKYRLLLCIGHDEYWTAQMRDTAEAFLAAGGNIAFFSGNTCWWQFRLEDNGQTFVCYRDALEDPLTGTDNEHVTVEWSSAPVFRPENILTGVSFRRGAGCWENYDIMNEAAWTTVFADHWVFKGTGLVNGAVFGHGTLGYETDAADTIQDGGTTCVTGRDGTPSSFVVLANADLSSWRQWGQGGSATMGIFRSTSGGRVFNAATIGWGNGLVQPVDHIVDQITRNVLSELSQPWPSDRWEKMGEANGVVAMVACENKVFAADSRGMLWARDPVGQNVRWSKICPADGIVTMASPREVVGNHSVGLYAVNSDGILLYRDPINSFSGWREIGTAPSIRALAASHDKLFAVTDCDKLICLEFSKIGSSARWSNIGDADKIVAMTNVSGRLFAVTYDKLLSTRRTVVDKEDWSVIGTCPEMATGLAGYAGKLLLSTASNELWWRDVKS